jgi:GR25 family glycosyltransferase involved in LPS biosynthesis
MRKLKVIIASKVRAMQLRALIQSLYYNLESYYPIDIIIHYSTLHTGYWYAAENYRVLKNEFPHIEFIEHIDINIEDFESFLIKDELNLLLTNNFIFNLPFNLDILKDIDFDSAVYDLTKGMNRQMNSNFSFRNEAEKYKKEDNVFYIDKEGEAFEPFEGISPFLGKIFLYKGENINNLKHYYPALSPCFINTCNSIENFDFFYPFIDERIEMGRYALGIRFNLWEQIDYKEIQGYCPNSLLDDYTFKFINGFNKLDNPFDKFDKIYYLNLDSREDRKNRIEEHFNKFGIKSERISSFVVKPEEVSEHNKGMVLDEYNLGLAPARIGCILTQLKAIQNAKEKGYQNVLIFEDDAFILEEHIEAFKEALKELEHLPKWDMLFLGANVLAPIHQVSPHIGRLTGAYCAHAYAVNSHFYDKILDFRWDVFKAYDEYLFNEMRSPNYNTYTVLPIVVNQQASYSNIEGKDVNYENVLINSYKDNLNKIL